MTITSRDRKILLVLPTLLVLGAYCFMWYEPGAKEKAALERRVEAAGRVPEVWRGPRAKAETDAKAAADELAAAWRKFEAARAVLVRERGDGRGERRTKPGALAALNKAASASGVTVVSAMSRAGGEPPRRDEEDGLPGTPWDVTFLGRYDEMTACLKALADEPGVLVRRIDRIPAEDGAARPIWNLVIEM